MFDVAIVGAGPAGAWTATVLARQGARVLLLDGSHPREKPCGGGITARAHALVASASGTRPCESVRIQSARFVDTNRSRAPLKGRSPQPLESYSVDLGAGSGLLVASRRGFDGWLLDAACAAGATFEPSRVAAISREPTGGFDLQTPAGRRRARVLVGADGVTSRVRRSLGTPLSRHQISIATGFFASGTTSNEIVIELLDDPPGYLWSFPRPDHLAIGICTQADTGVGVEALKERVRGWMRATGLGAGAPLDAYSWPIPSLRADDFARDTRGGSDWLLVGDAAGLVDPITREGIYFALRSAELAAHAILAGSPRGYAAAVAREIVPELAHAAALKDRFFNRRFRAMVVDALHSSPPVRHVMADLITGAQSYRGLRWRLARTLEVRLAARLVMGRVRGTLREHGPAPLAD